MSKHRARLHVAHPPAEDGLDIRLGGQPYPVIPPGIYKATGTGRTRVFYFRDGWKLAIDFAVLVPDPQVEFGTRTEVLARFFNVDRGPDKRILAPRYGDYRHEWVVASGRRPSRGDRMSPAVFKHVLFEVGVVTVEKNFHQRAHHDFYSKIGRVIRRLAGGAAL